MVLQLPKEALLNHVLEAPGLHEWFEGSTEVGNPDALLLALKLQEKIAVDSPIFNKLLLSPFIPSNLFTAAHLSSLANCLKVLFVYLFLFCCNYNCGRTFKIFVFVKYDRNPPIVSLEFTVCGLFF